jgi:hypothetical protein
MKYRFFTLFVLLLAMILVYPAFYEPGHWEILGNVLLTLMYAGAGWVVLVDAKKHRLKLAIAAAAVLGAWFDYFLPSGLPPWAAAVFFHGAGAVFQVFVIVVVLRTVYRERDITIDAIFAALCGYLLIGTTFAHLYCALEAAAPGSFKGDQFFTSPGRVHIALTYFSYVTLATVGYGDILPAGKLARSLAVIEAILGQFYIAVLVADLIGKRLSQSASPSPRI